MQVDNIGTHTIQEVLGVRDEHKDSLEPDKNHQVVRVGPQAEVETAG